MTENEAKLLDKLDELANDTEVDMYSVANLNFFFEESANTIRKLIEEIQAYRAIENRLKEVYGEYDGLLEIVVNGLVKYDNAPVKVIKSVLLTDDDVDKWDAYRAIGTVEELQDVYKLCESLEESVKVGDALVEELKKYQGIGTVEEIQQQKDYIDTINELLKDYSAIGTIEECRVAVDRMKKGELN